MGNSRRFLVLKKRVVQLGRDLLPPVNPVGGYSLQDQDQIRGFRILVHAEVEAFLEDLASEIVQKSLNRYTATGKANKILKTLAQAFCRSHRPTTGEDFYVRAVKQYQEDVIKGNHGIKEANICVLFLPIGIDRGLLDPAWLSTMSSFGAKRGEVAHSSFRVATVLDPVIENNFVQQLTANLEQFDIQLTPIRRVA